MQKKKKIPTVGLSRISCALICLNRAKYDGPELVWSFIAKLKWCFILWAAGGFPMWFWIAIFWDYQTERNYAGIAWKLFFIIPFCVLYLFHICTIVKPWLYKLKWVLLPTTKAKDQHEFVLHVKDETILAERARKAAWEESLELKAAQAAAQAAIESRRKNAIDVRIIE